MELKDIERLIKKGESEILKFKKSTGQRTSAAKTLCAMLNGSGGTVSNIQKPAVHNSETTAYYGATPL